MGIKERKERQKQQLRLDIFKAARDIAREEGWGNVSIRKISKKIEYSTIMVYELFGSKEKLMIALKDEGYRLLAERCAEKSKSLKDVEAIMEISDQSWSFAGENPELYQVMFELSGVLNTTDTAQEASKLYDMITPRLVRIFKVSETAGHSLFFNWWALVHGFISLRFLKKEMEEGLQYQFFGEAIDRFLSGK